MAEPATLTRSKTGQADGNELNAKLASDVEAVLEATERSHPVGERSTRRLHFQVPQAGVRYYSLPIVD